jgi:threonylcarbamoyladenosine tRNA methylthiotransferase MtaB
MPQVARPTIKERAWRMRDKGAQALRAHLDAQIGTCRRVLAETREHGRTEHFTPVRLAAPIEPGAILELFIAGHDGRQLTAA